ncbi:hypothetical protein LVD15_08545 [Fulvivirga maritima]|uniref:hypothetical protein n=1 Tax=Fulvivirga maritima TaxID=2904247 RepID=UPI001F32B5C4|nr:hypothetical protein [Fulvivirga maritima]UII28465.1 hypothetical protein LVD15_08545 [Fulvivirga maritima]
MCIKKYLIAFLFLCPLIIHAQQKELSEEYYENKKIPQSLEAPIREALSYYPELKDISIDFLFKEHINNAVMQAQPRIRTLFRSKYNRVYKIKMQKMISLNDSLKSISTLPDDIIVGWVAHELGHIVDYLNRSSVQMVGFGMRYFTSRRYLRRAERRADTYAIKHGFADYLIKTKKYILMRDDLPEDYRARIDNLYISPEEVHDIEQSVGTPTSTF